MISTKDYGANQGSLLGGTGTAADIASLSKALEVGYQTGANKVGGGALTVESLEASLKVLTFNDSHIKFWKKIPKTPAFNTIEEYNVLNEYGGDHGMFLNEGELGQTADSSYERKIQRIKYMGTVREVTHPMSLMATAHGDPIALENQNGILSLLRVLETTLFEGDSSLAFSGEGQQFDGLNAQIDPSMTIDLEGDSLQEADFEEGSNLILENFGYATDCFLPLSAASDYNKIMYPRLRMQMPAGLNVVPGAAVPATTTSSGNVELHPDVFLKQTPVPRVAATSPNAPATPTSIVAGAAAGTDGDHNKGAPSGDSSFAYVVTAVNRFGESAPTAVGSIVTLTQANKDAGVHVPLTITNAAVIGAFPPEYFRVYRSKASASTVVPTDLNDYALVLQVPAATQTASLTTVVNDVNYTLPFTSTAYMGELTPSVLTFRQLLPLMKLDLAVVSPAYRWAIMLYGAMILFAPKKFVRFTNIGRLSTP